MHPSPISLLALLLLPTCLIAQVPSAIGGDGVDLDGDGMSDLWEAYYAARALHPDADSDGDGHSNLYESRTGTDPWDAQSHFQLVGPTIQHHLQQLEFVHSSADGKRYHFQGSSDLREWDLLGEPLQGDGAAHSNRIQFDTSLPTRYFVSVDVLDADDDNDGLTAYEEQLIGYSDRGRHSNGSTKRNDFARIVEQLSSGESFMLNSQLVPGQLPTLEESARFLIQAGMGGNYALIEQISQTGFTAWLDAEFNRPPSYYLPRTLSLSRTFIDPDSDEEVTISPFVWSWWDINMRGNDMLRQRIAYALSQILVVSQQGSDILEDSPWGLADYYDLLVKHAFGNYQDLLYAITYHPVMGLYLSHAKNRKADASTNRFADENYARELMQLFSIGLYQLNQDGTRQQDADGNEIPTYSNADIREFARVFTGLTYDPSYVAGVPLSNAPGDSGAVLNEFEFLDVEPFMNNPMQAYEPMHDRGAKQLLRYTTVNGLQVDGALPAEQSTDQDIRAAIENIFNHPNVGPFLARHLIQRLVKSNPSPAYIQRVAIAFNDNGQGVRGDMQAVIRAILLDPEARNRGYLNDPSNGRLREPYMRYLHFCRAFNFTTSTGLYRNVADDAGMSFQQQPLAAPSVFNFYQPNHSPLGPLNAAGLVAPEFQITTASTSVATINFWQRAAFFLEPMDFDEEFGEIETEFDLETEYALMASDPAALVERLNLILTYGSMTPASKDRILAALEQTIDSGDFDLEDTVHLALYLFLNSPEFAVLR
jgi:uncharacterized protein (DUF1800 family)